MKNLLKRLSTANSFKSQQGIVTPVLLLLIAVAVVIVYLVVSSTLPFKNGLFNAFFPKDASKAAGVVDLSLVPNAVTVKQNDTFLVDVTIDAKTSQPTAMELEVNYDPAVLEMTALEPGFFFSKALVAPNITSGRGTVTLAQDIGSYKTGTGTVATLAFRALQNTTTASQITLNPSVTQIAALNEDGNVLNLITNSSVMVTPLAVINKNAQMTLGVPASAQPIGQEFPVQVRVRTATESANLFVAKLSFDPAKLSVSRIETGNSFITQWVNSYDNANGRINLIGGIPNPGYQAANLTDMATVYFVGEAAGAADINFDAASSIYRNSDNQDILGSTTNATANISTVVVSPSPSVTPSASPVVSPSPVGSVAPSPAVSPSPTASSAVSPSPAASVATSPSPLASASTAPSNCTITSANWVPNVNPINQGRVVGLNVKGSGDCADRSIAFTVWEDDGILGGDPVTNQPPSVKFGANGEANTSWLAEFQQDGFNGIGNPPEYFFNASLDGSTQVRSSNPLLVVNPVAAGQWLRGDANRDGVVNFIDLSILLSNWNKTSGFNDELDMNEDGAINTFDFSGMVQLLILGGLVN